MDGSIGTDEAQLLEGSRNSTHKCIAHKTKAQTSQHLNEARVLCFGWWC